MGRYMKESLRITLAISSLFQARHYITKTKYTNLSSIKTETSKFTKKISKNYTRLKNLRPQNLGLKVPNGITLSFQALPIWFSFSNLSWQQQDSQVQQFDSYCIPANVFQTDT